MILTEKKIRESAKIAKSMRLDESMLMFSEKNTYDLFISHSFKDKDLITGIYKIFDEAGYSVYVDWIDDSNLDRNNVNEKTALLIKERLKSCKALAYAATVNTPSSKWCPWELGLGDGMLGKVCILPIMESGYKGQEYLKMYPYLDYATEQKTEKNEFWINDPNEKEKYISLNRWLKGEKLTNHK